MIENIILTVVSLLVLVYLLVALIKPGDLLTCPLG